MSSDLDDPSELRDPGGPESFEPGTRGRTTRDRPERGRPIGRSRRIERRLAASALVVSGVLVITLAAQRCGRPDQGTATVTTVQGGVDPAVSSQGNSCIDPTLTMQDGWVDNGCHPEGPSAPLDDRCALMAIDPSTSVCLRR